MDITQIPTEPGPNPVFPQGFSAFNPFLNRFLTFVRKFLSKLDLAFILSIAGSEVILWDEDRTVMYMTHSKKPFS